ncbi:MAG: exodeoxyribonuclease III [Candidatus Moraniibacteriota bacterium]|nr:MAG: exodeoxyribonuclease III [Candidatus Moranbacteria bacterium]
MDKTLTLLSWNVNGIRAAERKGFTGWLERSKYDIVSVQETKVSDPSILSERLRHPDHYESYWHSASERKGYSGVAMYVKEPPLHVKTFFGASSLSAEGRVIEIEYPRFTLLNIYFPNGGSGEARLSYKLQFYREFLEYVIELRRLGKRVIFCGDVNTAHTENDLARPKENAGVSGFLPVEREWINQVIERGFVDTFRMFHEGNGFYTWWDMKTRARDRNVGWRLDYFFVAEELRENVENAFILPEIPGSDHCPAVLRIRV